VEKGLRDYYNNELIGAIAMMSILQHVKTLSYAKALLVYPMVSHKELLTFLKSENTVVRGLEELLAKKPSLFANFNDRYFSLLSISLDSMCLLEQLGIAKMENGVLLYNESNNFDLESPDLGKRAHAIIKGSKKLSLILQEEVSTLYLQLRVEI